MVNTAAGTVPAGGELPRDWLAKHFNHNDTYILYHLLRYCCTRHTGVVRRMQVLIDVDNQSVEGAFDRGGALDLRDLRTAGDDI